MSCPCETVEDGTVLATDSVTVYVNVDGQEQSYVMVSDVGNVPYSQLAL